MGIWKETQVPEIVHQIETNIKFASAKKPKAADTAATPQTPGE